MTDAALRWSFSAALIFLASSVVAYVVGHRAGRAEENARVYAIFDAAGRIVTQGTLMHLAKAFYGIKTIAEMQVDLRDYVKRKEERRGKA